jgi:hypothetical protein
MAVLRAQRERGCPGTARQHLAWLVLGSSSGSGFPMLRGLWAALHATAALVLVAGALLVALALPRTAHRAAASR